MRAGGSSHKDGLLFFCYLFITLSMNLIVLRLVVVILSDALCRLSLLVVLLRLLFCLCIRFVFIALMLCRFGGFAFLLCSGLWYVILSMNDHY